LTYFRQLHDPHSRAFTYLLGDLTARAALLVDPSPGQGTLYLALLDEFQGKLVAILFTHVHKAADSTGLRELQSATEARILLGRNDALPDAPIAGTLNDGEAVTFGNQVVHCLATPGHTSGSMSYQWHDRLFVGDTLPLNQKPVGCEAADEDGGLLFDSIGRRLMPLPDEMLVYPGHDFGGRRVTCIGEERESCIACTGASRDEFIAIRRHSVPSPDIGQRASQPRRSLA
jgi:sulfur dioxygenase